MKYSYEKGELKVFCTPDDALELIQFLTKKENIKSPFGIAMQKGFEANEVHLESNVLVAVANDTELHEDYNNGLKLAFVKRLKEITGLGLKDAKHSVDHAWDILRANQTII